MPKLRLEHGEGSVAVQRSAFVCRVLLLQLAGVTELRGLIEDASVKPESGMKSGMMLHHQWLNHFCLCQRRQHCEW